MTDRTYIKVARKAEYDGGYTTLTEVAGGVPSGEGGDGSPGPEGPQGPQGEGVPTGGEAGQILAKIDGTDFNTEWIDPPEGGGPSLDTLPWITIKRFKCEIFGMNNNVPDFTTTYDVNPLVNYFWRWDMDLYNNGNWKDVDDFDSTEQQYCPISIQMEAYLRLGNVTNERYPNAKIRYVVWVEDFNGKSSELISSEEPAFGHTGWNVPYEPPLFTDGGGGSTVDYASREYVDEQVASIPPIPPVDHLVSKNGESTVGSDFRLKQDKNDGSGKNNYLAIHDNYMFLYHVATPTSSHHGVNRQYVDDKIAELRAELTP